MAEKAEIKLSLDGAEKVIQDLTHVTDSMNQFDNTADDMASTIEDVVQATEEWADSLDAMNGETAKVGIEQQYSFTGLKEGEEQAKNLSKAQEDAANSTDSLSKQTNSLSGMIKSATSSIGQMTAAMLANPLGAAIAVVGALVASFGLLTRSFNDQIEAEINLLKQINATGREVDASIDRFTKFASAMQETTTFSEGTVLSLLSVGMQADVTDDQLERMAQTSLDMAAALGVDAEQAMTKLSIAMQDTSKSTSILTSAGITLTETQKEQLKLLRENGEELEAQEMLLEILENRFDGVSQSIAATPMGVFDQMKNKISDLTVEFGRFGFSSDTSTCSNVQGND